MSLSQMDTAFMSGGFCYQPWHKGRHKREAALVQQPQITTGYSKTLILFMVGSFLEGLRFVSVFCTEL